MFKNHSVSRRFAISAVAGLASLCGSAWADTASFPNRPVTVITAFCADILVGSIDDTATAWNIPKK